VPFEAGMGSVAATAWKEEGASAMGWHDGLREEQAHAAACCGQHARLLAGPGTGKTRCLTRHAAYLIEEKGVPPADILLVTFTRAATAYMRTEVERMLGPDADLPDVATLHSFALRTILRHAARTRLPQPVRIADDYEERRIIQEDLKQILGLQRVKKAAELLRQLSADWERLTADRDNWESRFPDARFLGAWREHREVYGYTLRAELVYQLKLALTSGDLQLEPAPRYLLVDEYQDLNACDLAVVGELVGCGAELYCAGDDDQSIYGFRYADPEGIRRFPDDYRPHELADLEECWRCGPSILRYALYVAEQDPRRLPKAIKSMREPGPGVVKLLHFGNQAEEAWAVARLCTWLIGKHRITPQEILILLRSDHNNRFSGPLEEQIAALGVPIATVVDPMAPLDEPEARHFLALLRLTVDQDDHLAWRTALGLTPGIGAATLAEIYDLARGDGVRFAEALGRVRDNPAIIARGTLVEDACNAIQTVLNSRPSEAADDPSAFIAGLAQQQLTDPLLRDAVLRLFGSIIEETRARTLGGVLQGLTAALGTAEQERPPGSVAVMTMHQAKGLSADAVIIVGAEDEYVPGRAQGSQVDDERRLLYVSMTRARDHLYITHCSKRLGRQAHSGRVRGFPDRTLSRFLDGGPVRSEHGMQFARSL